MYICVHKHDSISKTIRKAKVFALTSAIGIIDENIARGQASCRVWWISWRKWCIAWHPRTVMESSRDATITEATDYVDINFFHFFP